MAITVNQAMTVDADGNILLHGRSGFEVPMTWQDENEAPVSISAKALYFEIKGLLRKELVAGATQYERIVRLSRADLEDVPLRGVGSLFAVVDESGVVPSVIWEGYVRLRGFRDQPPA